MKAFENINIRRKLASFRTVFPHDDHYTDKNIEGIYDDVLGFARPVTTGLNFVHKAYWPSFRPGKYTESVTRAACKLLLLQIGSGATSLLMQALNKKPSGDVKVVLSTLMASCMSDVEELCVGSSCTYIHTLP
jgi:hypothetical protein